MGVVSPERGQKASIQAKIYDLLEAAPDAMILVDRSGRIESTNAQAELVFGYARNELLGKLVEQLMPQRYRRRHSDMRGGFFDTPSTRPMGAELDLFGLRKDGSEFPVDISLKAMETEQGKVAVAAVRDITQRKQVEKALKESEGRYALAEAIAHFGHCDRYFADGSGHWSAEVYRIFGLDPARFDPTLDSVLGRIHTDDRNRFWECFRASRCDGVSLDIEYRIVRPDGEERIIHSVGEVIFDDHGRPLKLLGTIHDVTDQRRAAQELRRREEELAHVSRLNTLGEIAAEFSHEVIQPLYAIANVATACVKILEANRDDSLTRAMDCARQIGQQADRAAEITRRIGHFVRKTPPQPSTINLNDVVHESVELVAAEARHHGITVNLCLDELLPNVLADRVQIEQILVNLLMNAYEAMRDTLSDDRWVKVTTLTEDHRVHVAVQDNGSGLSPEAMSKVFDAFYTSKADGFGMGLAISRRIIETHAGRLWLAPNADRGVTFHFVLPAASAPAVVN